jgi:glucosamine-6-phosphate deaminase
MRIIKTANYDQMSRDAANIISAQMILKPDCVLGLATGLHQSVFISSW